jgi:alpha-beta hydrolase superfamily lysophospholipase
MDWNYKIQNFTILNKDIKLNTMTHNDNKIYYKAVLIHLHGLGSHFQTEYDCMNRFDNRVIKLEKLNIISYGLELRGHGLSEGNKCYINNFNDYLSDVKCLVEYIKLYHMDKKHTYL